MMGMNLDIIDSCELSVVCQNLFHSTSKIGMKHLILFQVVIKETQNPKLFTNHISFPN